jgi:hypothetical protein
MQGYALYLIVGAVFGFFLSILSFRYRKIPGRRYLWIFSSMVVLLIITTFIELISQFFTTKLMWRNIQQFPLFFIGLCMYGFHIGLYRQTYGKHEKTRGAVFTSALPVCTAYFYGSLPSPHLKVQAELLVDYVNKIETTLEFILPGESGISYSAALIPIGSKNSLDTAMLMIFSDISDKKRYERDLIQQATIDELTGINNRGHFLKRVREQLVEANSGLRLCCSILTALR